MKEKQKLAPDKQEKVDKFRILNQYAKKGATLFVGSSLMEGFPINEFLICVLKRFLSISERMILLLRDIRRRVW